MNEKILVVEDDPDIMHILVAVLRGAGYQVISAYGAEDAIRKLGLHKFDLVLTDLAMPRVSGVAVVQEVKENPETEHIPVIAVTAYTWESLAQAASQAGCDGYVCKPFTNQKILQEVQKYLKLRKG